ncbi:MAG TPA: DNA gyrase inhibitor YacG [Caulobacteraceae bacterium]|jgi:endogenous inhibitor of DNA gyrase (YacG/DUF329 family)|nr:DNA gyrase inhibitor YacG [Caulobacteraceae bacterium]
MTVPACPICAKPQDPAYKPFCSRRCADVDLQRWFSGRYAVPVVEGDDEAPEEEAEGGA